MFIKYFPRSSKYFYHAYLYLIRGVVLIRGEWGRQAEGEYEELQQAGGPGPAPAPRSGRGSWRGLGSAPGAVSMITAAPPQQPDPHYICNKSIQSAMVIKDWFQMLDKSKVRHYSIHYPSYIQVSTYDYIIAFKGLSNGMIVMLQSWVIYNS